MSKHSVLVQWSEVDKAYIATVSELPGLSAFGSSPEEAAKRELKEELSCDVEIVSKLGENDFTENGYEMGYTWFLASINDQIPVIGEPEKFDRYDYISIDDLDKFNLSPNMKNLFEEIKNKKIILK